MSGSNPAAAQACSTIRASGHVPELEPMIQASSGEVLEPDAATAGEPVAGGQHRVHVVVEQRLEHDAVGRRAARRPASRC